jgi:hypothetical protein
MPNRLAHESSPYLLQHAANPVDWYPWGDEAFAAARDQDRPILLSVGYSACHWCHVMAHESFEDESIAALMNDWFVNVKVDREERPDVDSVYMAATQAMTGQGGWPMTVFLTPDGRPFYAGTYFPPVDGFGRPGFPRVLEALHNAWVDERAKLLASAEGILEHLQAATRRAPGSAVEPTPALLAQAVDSFRNSFDHAWGGFGGAPKFPSPGNLEFLLQYHASGLDAGDPTALDMVLLTLERMASGGMYDQLGGGFARYSVDARWLVPHFEKMLYDNAQLARLYLHAWQVTGEPFFERVARETLDYVVRDMQDPAGGFFSATDADSEGVEGKYFVWTVAEVRQVLGDGADLFLTWHGVTPEGNFRDPHHPELSGRNVLTAWRAADEVAPAFDLAADEFEREIARLRARMLEARSWRVPPGLDDKVLTSWNGLALAAFAEAARVLGDQRYREAAGRNAAFIRGQMWREGRLLHSYRAGTAKVEGMLEDYAYYGLGLVELFKLTGDMEHLEWARELFERILADFRDPERGAFFETARDGEPLLLRQKPLFDGPTPSGNGATALVALWLGRYYATPEWEALATEVLAHVGDHLLQAASGFGSLWQAAAFMLAPRREATVFGAPGLRAPLERELARQYQPWLVVAPSSGGEALPLLEGRDVIPGRALAYLCEDMVCGLPSETPDELSARLRAWQHA